MSIALDSFGAGYSSLSHLRDLHLDMLTIDRSFVDGVGHSDEDTTIIEHIIGMAKALGIVVVAEGVEDERQVELLRQLNCDLAQGFYFSHPQPPYVITDLLQSIDDRGEWRPPEPEVDDGSAPVVMVESRFATTD